MILAVIVAAALAFGVASLGFPAQMATMFERTGAYSVAMRYASLAYTYKPTMQNLERCVNDSVFCGDNGNTVNYGEMLLSRGEFEEYYAQIPGAKQFITGSIARAYYANGNKQQALATAQNAVGKGFPKPNALGALALSAYDASDREFMDSLIAAVRLCTPVSPEENQYKQDIITLLSTQK